MAAFWNKRSQPLVEAVTPPPRPVWDVKSQAIRIAGVYRSVSIIATAISQMSGGTYQGITPTDKATWLYQPDPDMSGAAFTELTVTSLAIHGNAFWRIFRNSRNEPIALKFLHPDEVGVERRDGTIVYTYQGHPYSQKEIKHLQLLRLPGQDRGIGPIQASRYTLEGMLALQAYQNEWFSGRGIPQGILKTDQPLSQDLADQYEARWNAKLQQAADNGNAPIAVLGSGVDYKPILINPKDAMYLEICQFGVAEIGRLYGIPPLYLGIGMEGSSLTYTTAVDMDIAFLRYTLTQYINEVENAVSDLLPRKQYYKFDTSSILRTNDKARYESYEIALRAGFLTVDEVRKYENLPAMSGTVIDAVNTLSNEEGA